MASRDLELVSSIVAEVVYYTMASQSKTLAQRNSTLTAEYLVWVKCGGLMKCHFGGSSSEGTALQGSDLDNMVVDPNITVCPTEEARIHFGNIFLADRSGCQLGYTKLRLLRSDPNIELLFNHSLDIEDILEMQIDGTSFLSTEKIIRYWINRLQRGEAINVHHHGPCATSVFDTGSTIKGLTNVLIEKDMAYAIALDTWPVEAEEWFTRERRYNWPNQELIENMRTLPCHVVPIGDKTSSPSPVIWRISYLLAERDLVWSFNDSQIQCHVLMKRLMKLYFNPISPEELSSYQMKTIIFWVSENNPANFWQDDNLLSCVQSCLIAFRDSIKESYLPHYIDRRNLLAGKLGDAGVRQRVLDMAEEVLADLVSFVLRCVIDVHLLAIWEASCHNAEEFLKQCQETLDPHFSLGCDDYRPVADQYQQSLAASTNMADLIAADSSTLVLFCVAYEEDIPRDIQPHFTEHFKRYLNIRIAISQSRELLDRLDQPRAKHEAERLQQLFMDNDDFDALSSKLHLATFLYMLGRWDDSSNLLQQLLTSKPKQLIYAGVSSNVKTILLSNNTAIQKLNLPILTNPSYSSTAADVYFSRQDVLIVPHAVRFECMMERAIEIYPLVYLYYLMYVSAQSACPGGLHYIERFLGENARALQLLERAVKEKVASQPDLEKAVKDSAWRHLKETIADDKIWHLRDQLGSPIDEDKEEDGDLTPWELAVESLALIQLQRVGKEEAEDGSWKHLERAMKAIALEEVVRIQEGSIQGEVERETSALEWALDQASALNNLEETVMGCRGSPTHYRGLNLLGHCYLLAGNFQKAAQCFSDSLRQTAPRNVQNAAVYHLAILIVGIINLKQVDNRMALVPYVTNCKDTGKADQPKAWTGLC